MFILTKLYIDLESTNLMHFRWHDMFLCKKRIENCKHVELIKKDQEVNLGKDTVRMLTEVSTGHVVQYIHKIRYALWDKYIATVAPSSGENHTFFQTIPKHLIVCKKQRLKKRARKLKI